MAFKPRKLFEPPPDCFLHCTLPCQYTCTSSIMPSPLPPYQDSTKSPLIIGIITVTAVSLFFVLYIALFKKDQSNNLSDQPNPPPAPQPDEEQHIDENLGPVYDNPIWLIRTAGLQPGLIKSITAYKYKKGEGLIEGTDCSVCLSEFQEDETLRILPKCSHAFHINCIDTWLSSHTNCPLCRSPIVTAEPSSSPADQSSPNMNRNEENQIRSNESDDDELRENIAETNHEDELVIIGNRIGVLKDCQNSSEATNHQNKEDEISSSTTMCIGSSNFHSANSEGISITHSSDIVQKQLSENMCMSKLMDSSSIAHAVPAKRSFLL